MDFPVSSEIEGIKIKPEKMEQDKLYHCIYNNRVLLFYKDHDEILNCYEIEEKELVDSIIKSKSSDEVEKILQDFIQKEKLEG